MATKLALWFLPFLLFFLMNGHGIGGRDLKVELKDHADTNSQSYIKHKHPSHSHHGNLNQPYITSYQTSNVHDANKPNYLIGYLTSTHDSDVDKTNYLVGYRTNTRDFDADKSNYLVGYRTSIHDSDANKPNYLVGYRTSTHDSDADKSNYSDADKPNYLVGYRTSTHDSDKDLAFWSTKKAYNTEHKTATHDAKRDQKQYPYGTTHEPYITQYGDLNLKGDSNEPYITQYGDAGSNKHTKDSATAQHSASPYLTNYATPSKKEKGGPPSSNVVDHTEAFKVGFFAMDDLYVGNIMTLQFPVEEFSHFLSKKQAESIPFSTSQLPSILQLFGVSEDSPQAMSMRGTIDQCEAGTITGETKICANSLESMLEFVNNIIGSEEKHEIHTTSPPSGAPLQKYSIMKVSEDMYAPKWVACHPLPYPYAVYYCHFISTGTRVFKVLLGGENGDKVEALGVCHLDTSDWSPNHILFKQLGFMPGEAPVCHFFPVKHLMWVPQPSKVATM